MSRWNWRMGMAWAGGMVGESLWIGWQPDPNPWIRIPAALLAAVAMAVLVAWFWAEQPK